MLKLPMEAVADDPLGPKPGDRLWPEWFTHEMVVEAKKDVRSWNALYQQDPVPDTGGYFEKNDFTDYLTLPERLHIYAASDYAVAEGRGDFTEHGVFGIDYNGDLFIIDWRRGQTAGNVWIERQCDLITEHKPLIWFGESGPIRRAIEPFLRKRMQERQAFCRLEWLPSVADKVVRARAIQARGGMGKGFLPKAAPWKADLLSPLLKFPAGKHDDAVDVMSLIGRGLEFAKTPEIPRAPVQPEFKGIDRRGPLGWIRM